MPPRLAHLLLAATLLAVPLGRAAAQATVDVEVRLADGAADGRVELAAAQGDRRYACRTQGGRCTIADVAGGRYIVRFEPAAGPGPAGRPVMIPPSGRVSLIVGGGS